MYTDITWLQFGQCIIWMHTLVLVLNADSSWKTFSLIKTSQIKILCLTPTIKMLLAPPGGGQKNFMVKSQSLVIFFCVSLRVVENPWNPCRVLPVSTPVHVFVHNWCLSVCVQVFQSSTTVWRGSSVRSSASCSLLWLARPATAALCDGAGGGRSSWLSVLEHWLEWLCFWMDRW